MPLERDVQPHPNDRSPERRLRIGYVSPHFRNQATSFFTAPLLGAHDRAHFEIYCYADVLRRDEITVMLQQRADVWRDVVGQADEQIAAIIRQDKIDILIDLTMHMAEGRPLLFARKPAPVQVAWLAYPGTTGLTTMDYRLTDPHLDPFDAAQAGPFDAAQGGPPGLNDAYYSEISYRLPDTALCYHPLTAEPAVNSLPALRNGRVTFGSLNQFAKANDMVLRMWAATLAAVPNSRMLVLAPRGSHRQRLEDALRAAGGDPRQIEYLDRQPRQQYLEFYHRIDIVLDTYPYNGETTSLDGLWMGVPMVTLCGTTAPSRAGLCFLSHLGLVDLVAKTPEQFAQIAARLAGDLPRLAELRQTLRGADGEIAADGCAAFRPERGSGLSLDVARDGASPRVKKCDCQWHGRLAHGDGNRSAIAGFDRSTASETPMPLSRSTANMGGPPMPLSRSTANMGETPMPFLRSTANMGGTPMPLEVSP